MSDIRCFFKKLKTDTGYAAVVSEKDEEFVEKEPDVTPSSSHTPTYPSSSAKEDSISGAGCIKLDIGSSLNSNDGKKTYVEELDIGNALNKNLKDVEKYKFLTECWKPPQEYAFPSKVEGKQTRKFNKEWLNNHNWLAYSAKLSGGLCKYCVLFAPPAGAGVGNQPLKTLVKEPLTKFKKATEDFRHHANTEYHKFSVEKALCFKESLTTDVAASSNVSLLLNKQQRDAIESNRKRLVPIIKTVIFCAQNNLPLRGHRDDGSLDSSEALKGTQGVFRSLLAFRMDAGDEILKSHLANSKKTSTLISKTIQNEIIESVGEILRTEIVTNIKKNKFFSILCDETTDASNKEQLTFCVRYIDLDTCLVKEEFLGFIELKSTTSLAIKTAIDAEMSKLNLNYEFLCGQGYDGGSNMAGRLNGVQALVSAQQPLAIYTHCFSHSLNLCLTKSCEISTIRNVMGTVGSVCAFFSASALRSNALSDAITDLNYNESKKQKLKSLCPTRWVERHDSIMTFKELLEAIVAVLEDIISTGTAEASAKAFMMSSAIKRSEFIVGLEVSAYCLNFTHMLSQQLQTPKQDISSAMTVVSDVLEVFRNVRRNAEQEFDSIFENAVLLGNQIGCDISVPRTCNRQSTRNNTPSENAEEYFRRSIFVPLVDHFIGELSTRFNKDFNGVLALEGLIPSNLARYSDKQILESAKKYSAILDSQSSSAGLNAELKLWRIKWSVKSLVPSTVIDTIKDTDKNFFPCISVLLQIFGTIPVTTSTAERSFSVLRRLKTYLRSSMGENRLNGLALAHIAKDRNIEVSKVIDLFAKMKPRRMCLNNWETIDEEC